MIEDDQGWLSSTPLDMEYGNNKQSNSPLNIQHNPCKMHNSHNSCTYVPKETVLIAFRSKTLPSIGPVNKLLLISTTAKLFCR